MMLFKCQFISLYLISAHALYKHVCVGVGGICVILNIYADMVTINHQTVIQFPCGEFYYMGTLSEFAIISLRSFVRTDG